MIERCLVFQMSRDDCVRALAKHAKIEPIVTLTVWKELLKENKGFFQAYFQAVSQPSHFSYSSTHQRTTTFRRRKHWR
ncbi:hypothetical protein COLO4_29054 [Corchorus olitorius]|uniref:Uncharacterized protein n=1 Tax=Corchorus olitorius TaxID=93759 RepID=A0A1R3HGD9_9ROSI|nr:hypothetical protein COLO4_29054 [Corchorus olitorius]